MLPAAVAAIGADGKACPSTQLPQVPVSQVKQAIFQEANRDGITVGSLYNQCSYGKTRLTSLNSLVAPLVKLPCNGTTNDVAWTFSKCDFDDFNGYAGTAVQQYRRTVLYCRRFHASERAVCRAWSRLQGTGWASSAAQVQPLLHPPTPTSFCHVVQMLLTRRCGPRVWCWSGTNTGVRRQYS